MVKTILTEEMAVGVSIHPGKGKRTQKGLGSALLVLCGVFVISFVAVLDESPMFDIRPSTPSSVKQNINETTLRGVSSNRRLDTVSRRAQGFFEIIFSWIDPQPQEPKPESKPIPQEVPSLPSSCTTNFPPPPPLPGKKGAAFTLRSEGQRGHWAVNMPKVIALQPYWNYNWAAQTVDAQPDGIEFVPMVWGAWGVDSLEKKLQEQVRPHVESGKYKRLLGFNEPDFKQQSNMNVKKALEYWPQLESLGIPLATPSAGHPEREWMELFMENATATCMRTDWLGVHWYGNANFEAFKSFMTNLYEKFERPLIITEFAPADWKATSVETNKHSPADVLAFMKKALPWLEEQEWVAGYAWFSFGVDVKAGTSSALFDEDGEMTACGRYYASVRTDNPVGDQTIQVHGLSSQ